MTATIASFASPKRRISAAKEHIVQFEAGCRLFLETKPYARVVEKHPDGIHDVHKITFTTPIWDGITDSAIGAIEAFRAALDQAGYVSAICAGMNSPKSTFFPIADSEEALERDVIRRGRCKHLPPDILSLFRSFKPYKGGNDIIWALNQAANWSKHRLLVPVGVQTGGCHIRHFRASNIPYGIRFPPTWDGDKYEIVIGIFGGETQVDYDMDLSFFISFGKIEGISNRPAIDTLNAMSCEVESIVLATETECRRLGIIS